MDFFRVLAHCVNSVVSIPKAMDMNDIKESLIFFPMHIFLILLLGILYMTLIARISIKANILIFKNTLQGLEMTGGKPKDLSAASCSKYFFLLLFCYNSNWQFWNLIVISLFCLFVNISKEEHNIRHSLIRGVLI